MDTAFTPDRARNRRMLLWGLLGCLYILLGAYHFWRESFGFVVLDTFVATVFLTRPIPRSPRMFTALVERIASVRDFTLDDVVNLTGVAPAKRPDVSEALLCAVDGGLLEVRNEDDPSFAANRYGMRRWTGPEEPSGEVRANARAQAVVALIRVAVGA